MKIIFYEKGVNDEPIVLGNVVVNGTIAKNRKGFLTTIDLNLRNFLSEYLGETVLQTGVRQIRFCGDFWSSWQQKKGVKEDVFTSGMRSFTIGGRTVAEDAVLWPEDPVVLCDKGKTDMYVGVDVFDEGFVLKSTAAVTNILGGHSDAYFEKITAKNFKMSDRDYAKVFKNESALKKYLLEKEHVFTEMCSRNGWMFSWEPASRLYVQGRTKNLSGKVFDDIQEILDRINSADEEIPSYNFGSTPEDEAAIRMEELDLWAPVKRDFARGKLYMSEFGGVQYDLNEEAKEAVRRTEEFGLPYHVVRTNSPEMGDMYAVLYVSNYRMDWDGERLDPRDGLIIANVYNASMGIDEIGTIAVKKANGGLQRTA